MTADTGNGSTPGHAGRHTHRRRRRALTVVAAALTMALVCGAGGAWMGRRVDGDVAADGVAPVGAVGTLSRDAVPSADAAVAQRRLDTLRDELTRRIEGYQGIWQVYAEDLATGASIAIDSHRSYSASVIKLYVMLSVFQRIADGSLVESDAIDTLLEQMITVSSNEATNTLIDLLGDGDADAGFATVNRIAAEYGFEDTFIDQYLGVVDGDPTRKQTSASDAGRFMAAVYRGELVSPAWSERMLGLLLAQTRRTKIPGGVPTGTAVANKTGEIDGVENDAAIVFATADTSAAIDGSATTWDYVLAVLTEGVTDSSAAQASIRDLSAAVWAAMEG